jgi:hypothetical protein
MLVSIASILPLIVVGYIADQIGTTAVILVIAVLVTASGIASIVSRGPLRAGDEHEVKDRIVQGTPLDPAGSTLRVVERDGAREEREPR